MSLRNIRQREIRRMTNTIKAIIGYNSTAENSRDVVNGFRSSAAKQLDRIQIKVCGATMNQRSGGCTTVR